MAQINICCLNVGTKYSQQDTDNLYKMVKRNISYDFDFTCITDEVVPGVWNKLLYFSNLYNFDADVCIAFDLDIIIRENIDELVDWAIGNKNISVCRAWWRFDIPKLGIATPYNSSIITWHPKENYNIKLNHDEIYKWPGIDYYLEYNNIKVNTIPIHFYYSVFYASYFELDYPIALLNQAARWRDEDFKIEDECLWITKYK